MPDSLLTFLAGASNWFYPWYIICSFQRERNQKKIKEQAKKGQELAVQGYSKVAKEAEKGAKVVKEKAEEGIEAIKEFLEKKKTEAAGEKPEFPEDLETEK